MARYVTVAGPAPPSPFRQKDLTTNSSITIIYCSLFCCLMFVFLDRLLGDTCREIKPMGQLDSGRRNGTFNMTDLVRHKLVWGRCSHQHYPFALPLPQPPPSNHGPSHSARHSHTHSHLALCKIPMAISRESSFMKSSAKHTEKKQRKMGIFQEKEIL